MKIQFKNVQELVAENQRLKEVAWLNKQLNSLNIQFNNLESREERSDLIGDIVDTELKLINLQNN